MAQGTPLVCARVAGTIAHPCRTFAAAVSVVASGGQVVVLDSAAYGPVTITKSVSLIAPAGVFAGIEVTTGNGVTISTTGVKVRLSGLTINGLGGSYGVYMIDGASLVVENSSITNFSNGEGIAVNAPVSVQIANSLVSNNLIGIDIAGGAAATIVKSLILGNPSAGIYVTASASQGGTSVDISDSNVAGN